RGRIRLDGVVPLLVRFIDIQPDRIAVALDENQNGQSDSAIRANALLKMRLRSPRHARPLPGMRDSSGCCEIDFVQVGVYCKVPLCPVFSPRSTFEVRRSAFDVKSLKSGWPRAPTSQKVLPFVRFCPPYRDPPVDFRNESPA